MAGRTAWHLRGSPANLNPKFFSLAFGLGRWRDPWISFFI
jgi:hypothetical protein